MRALAQLISSGRIQAGMVAFFGNIIPFISPAAVSLVTLTKGLSDGFVLSLYAITPLIIILIYATDVNTVVTMLSIFTVFCVLIGSSIMRLRSSWQEVLVFIVVFSAISTMFASIFFNHSLVALENIIKELEQAHHVFLTGTGFGGVALALMSVCRPGDEILVSDNVYGPTKEISEDLLKEFEINAIFYDPESFEDLKNKVTKKTRIIVVENPGSITFEFQDLSKIVNLAKRKNILTFLDNTWGTPLYLKPLKIGFDMSFTSATKYFSGHSDAMGGSLRNT